jgi:hypothetical protein
MARIFRPHREGRDFGSRTLGKQAAQLNAEQDSLIQINDLSGQTCRIDPLAAHPREEQTRTGDVRREKVMHEMLT